MHYHVALTKGMPSRSGIHWNGHRADTLVVEAVRVIDNLSPQVWKYCGVRDTTKSMLRRNAAALVAAVNREHGTNFRRAVVI